MIRIEARNVRAGDVVRLYRPLGNPSDHEVLTTRLTAAGEQIWLELDGYPNTLVFATDLVEVVYRKAAHLAIPTDARDILSDWIANERARLRSLVDTRDEPAGRYVLYRTDATDILDRLEELLPKE